jgi:hemerythrin superfamily protein
MTDTTAHDVIDVLVTDHREVETLFTELETGTGTPEHRRDVADVVIAELVRHAVAEEMYVYPAMKQHLPDGEAAVEHDIQEHKELERTMKELESLDAADARFTEVVSRLRDQLHHHATDEEDEQFPRLRTYVSREKLVQMREQVDKAKKLAPTRPHPGSPNNEVFHKLVGPGVGLMDRVRDKLTGRSSG